MLRSFAVVDVETTGLRPRSDRVVEIAVIRISETGDFLEQFETMVNPRRDVGASHIHGLTATILRDAPAFDEIAGSVLELLRGSTLVAHNVRFDERFLRGEFERMGIDLPTLPVICTMDMSSRHLPGRVANSLAACCAAVGVTLDGAHRAMLDCQAAAALFRALRQRSGEIGILADGGSREAWPVVPVRRAPMPRSSMTKASESPTLLARISRHLNPIAGGGDTAVYFDLLSRALEDRILSTEETETLNSAVKEWNLSLPDVESAHRKYMQELIALAYADSVLTANERADIDSVARTLGLDAATVEELWQATRSIECGS